MRPSRHFSAAWLLLGLLLATPNPGNSQAAPTTRSSSGTGVAIDNSGAAAFLLGADDVIEVTVGNHSDLNRTLNILPDGKIGFPEIGEIMAAGKTPRALAAEIQQAIEKTRNNVSVIVTVKEVHSRKVRILGAVKVPGTFDLKSHWKLVDLTAAAGGLGAKPARISARIIRNGASVIPLDVEHAMAAPEGSANVALEPDDLVLFDELDAVKSQAYVMGQVVKPGAYDTDSDTSVLSLLSMAGNATEQAALTKAYVLRHGARVPLNLRPLLVEGRADAEVSGFKVQSGDMLFIPENDQRYSVMGQVGKPGYYSVPENGEVTLLQAINLAGGPGASGDLSKSGIIRMVNGKAVVQPVNIDAILKKGRLADNIALRPGDVLYVPERGTKHGFTFQDLLTPLSALSILGIRIVR